MRTSLVWFSLPCYAVAWKNPPARGWGESTPGSFLRIVWTQSGARARDFSHLSVGRPSPLTFVRTAGELRHCVGPDVSSLMGEKWHDPHNPALREVVVGRLKANVHLRSPGHAAADGAGRSRGLRQGGALLAEAAA